MGQFTFGLLNVLAEIQDHNIGLGLTSNAKLAKKTEYQAWKQDNWRQFFLLSFMWAL